MRIYLTPIKKEDGRLIVKWRNSDHVKDHCFSKATITEESNAEFYKNYIETGKYKQFIVNRVEEVSGVASYPIATVYLKDMDYDNHRCELCIFTSDDEEWNSESQIIAIKQLIDMAFNEYGMHKVYSYLFAKNLDEVELLKSAGMTQEAVFKDEALSGSNNYEDVLRMCVVNTRD